MDLAGPGAFPPLPAALVALLLAAPHPAQAQQAPVAVDLELVLAADGSGSIDDAELALQRDGYADAITHPDVLASIASGSLGRIGLAYVEWGGATSQHTIVDWTVIDGPAAAAGFADALRSRARAAHGWNSISGALDHAAALIADPAMEGTRKVIDVSGDGPQFGGRPVELARDEAVAAGITINALVLAAPGSGGHSGPGGMALSDHYTLSVIGGFGAFVMVADRGESFRRAILAKLIREIADGRPTGDPVAGGQAAARPPLRETSGGPLR